MKSKSLQEFLTLKGAEYAPFDPLRAFKILKKLDLNFSNQPLIVQIIGTNGKGSTGRFLALMLHKLGIDVGHFTSPHLLEFNERFWRNGSNIADSILQEAFLELEKQHLEEASYFEVLTFLVFKVFNTCEIVIIEAGLGGEYDSTTTCMQADLTLFTNIGIDHQEFLGNTIKDIAITKLNAMAKRVILGFQSEVEVVEIAQKIAQEKQAKLEVLTKIPLEILNFIHAKSYPQYQARNLALAWAALKEIKALKEIPVFNLKTCLKTLPPLDLRGRMQFLTPKICLDVAHNVNGAEALMESLKNTTFSQNKCILIYNSYKDKNPKEILSIIKPIIKSVVLLKVSNVRIMEKSDLEMILRELGLEYGDFKGINPQENYLVCGSFSVVAEFLKLYNKQMESK